MATEVTVKLISLSLGKIQQSKQIKSGLNLRKSLLVASVLYKAKDIYMTEIKNRRADQQQPSKKPRFTSQKSIVEPSSPTTDEDETEFHQDESNNERIPEADCDSHQTPDNSTTSSPRSADYEAETAAAAAAISPDTILDELASEGGDDDDLNKENSPPTKPNTTTACDKDMLISTRAESLSCRPCLKRRSSHFEPDSTTTSSTTNSDTPTQSDSLVKKARVDTTDYRTTDSSGLGQSAEPHNESGNQINSLVHIFSSGFSTIGNHTQAPSDTTGDSDSSSPCYIYSRGRTAPSSTEMNTFTLCRESIALTA